MQISDIEALFAPFGRVSIKRMFGGHGIYADGLCFGIEMDGEIYLKTDAATRAGFEANRSRPFVYSRSKRKHETSYWLLVESAYDDEAEFVRWSRLGLEAARRFATERGKRPAFASDGEAGRAKPAPRKSAARRPISG